MKFFNNYLSYIKKEMTTYYTDSTTPTAYKDSSAYSTGIANKITYALYEDTATWSAWESWA